jgi:hypothetical protein
VREGLEFPNNGLLLLVGDYSIRQLVLYEKDFGWMAFWELNREVLGSLLLMVSAAWGRRSVWMKAFMIGEGGPCPFGLCPGICLITEEKHGKPQSG